MTVTDITTARIERDIDQALARVRRLFDPQQRRQLVDLVHDAALSTFDGVEHLNAAQTLGEQLGHRVNVETLTEVAEALDEYNRADDGPEGRDGQAGRLGAHVRWAKETDRTAATAPARDGFMAKFERQVDPDGLLTTQERAIRAEHAMRAHMTRLGMKAKKARTGT